MLQLLLLLPLQFSIFLTVSANGWLIGFATAFAFASIIKTFDAFLSVSLSHVAVVVAASKKFAACPAVKINITKFSLSCRSCSWMILGESLTSSRQTKGHPFEETTQIIHPTPTPSHSREPHHAFHFIRQCQLLIKKSCSSTPRY